MFSFILLILIIICFFQIKSLKKEITKLEDLMVKYFLQQSDNKKSVEQSEKEDNNRNASPSKTPLFLAGNK